MNKYLFPIVLVVAAVVLGFAPILHNAYTNELLLRAVMTRTTTNIEFAPLASGVLFANAALGALSLLAGIALGWKVSLRSDL